MKNRVGLGTFPLADVFSKVTPQQAGKIIQIFTENGGYYIDTAPMYGFGDVEKFLGKVCSEFPREDFYVATKCGYIGIEGKSWDSLEKSSKYDDVIRECEKSLKRLRIDYIDLYFVHSPDPDTPFDETIEALTKLQDDGKIKEIGVSNVNLGELKEYNKTGKVKFIQNRFSLINRSIDKDFEKYLIEHNVRLIPYQLIDRGQLSNKVLDEINLREGDLRIPRPDWQQNQLKIITSWVKNRLYPIAKDLDIAIEQLAIAWALHQKYMDFVIVGATNTNQILSNLKADEIKLPDEILKKIDAAYAELEAEIKEKHNQTIREFRGLNEKFY